jgi:carboxyl-terminal processing protease
MPALRRFTLGLLPLAVLLGSGSVLHAEGFPKLSAPGVDSGKLQAEAERAERAGKWDAALDLYLKAYLGGKPTAELRDRIRFCLRNVTQLQRHRDPAFQQFILSLPVADALTLYTEAITKIQTLYVERERATFEKLMLGSLDELDRAVTDSGFRQQHLPDAAELKLLKFRQTIREGWRAKLPANASEVRRVARDIVVAAQTNLGVKNPSAIVLELLCGACSGLDEYTAYVVPTGANAELASPILEFASYGLLIAFDSRGLVIDAVVPNSWAALHTTLRRGDRIAKVNDKDMAGVKPLLLRDALKAQPTMLGHDLELPATEDPESLTKFRLPTPLPTVYGANILKGSIGYLRVSSFKEPTAREIDEAIEALKLRGMKALILDLRGNPGGSLTAGIAAAQRFLPNGIIVTTQGQSAEFGNRIFSSDAGTTAHEMPVVLLVDTRTMSSAEVFAAGLKDNGRATLVGLPTFGKGFVQSPIRLDSLDGSETTGKSGFLVLSVASAHTPRGQAINGGGVVPHFSEVDPDRQITIAVGKALDLLTSPSNMPTMR